MASFSESSSTEKQGTESVGVNSLRKVTSLSALRGRSSSPRAGNDGSAYVASKPSRAASLGRCKNARLASTSTKQRPLPSPVPSMDNRRCGYHPPAPAHHGVEHSETRAWAAGRISMMFLLFVTITDTAFKVVNNQMSQIESHDYYDALSPDVIRPAFLYKSGISIEKPSLGLGSAAISSITDALGPILPFTGGVDLRRSEYYAGNMVENLFGLVQQTYQAYADAKEESIVELGTFTTEISKLKKTRTSKKGRKKHALSLGASEPFVALEKIAELTLRDVGTIFEYATRRTQQGFNHGKFQNGVLPRVKTVIQAMEKAVSKSRGQGIRLPSFSAKEVQSGNMDAFFFCALMRCFAEWRVLRQVPEGYKGYAVGMTLGQKDVVQNVAKIERAAQSWVEHHLEFNPEVVSPTLRDILQYEIDMEVHAILPRLQEHSGAMGLLWVRRQLLYQTVIFQNVLEVPSKYSTAREAVVAAYKEVYGEYHGWAVQKVFSYSFQASPPVQEIYKFMNPHRLAELDEIAHNMESKLTKTSEEEERVEEAKEKHQMQPPENIFHRIGWELDKLGNAIGHHLGKAAAKGRKDKRKQPGGGLDGSELEDFISMEMEKNVHQHIVLYSEVVKLLLSDLACLFSGLNMDDPTKV